MNWYCKHTWSKASVNTLWCLLGCSIGDFGTIFYFQNIEHALLTWQVMSLAIVNGLLTSILLETFILSRQMLLKEYCWTFFGQLLACSGFHRVVTQNAFKVNCGGWAYSQDPLYFASYMKDILSHIYALNRRNVCFL